MSRIYAVKILLPEPKVRLVRAANINAALRHVASHLLYAEVATQETLVSLTMCGVAAILDAEIPAHLDRRQKAAVW